MTMIGTFYRVFILTLNTFLILFALGTVFAKPSFAAEFLVERPENELLILELYINDELRDRTLLGYLPAAEEPSKTLLPIGALSRKLSYAIDVDPVTGVADGWFLQESNAFQLDLARQVILINGEESALPLGAAEAHYEDIYVQAKYLEEWFGLNISTDTSVMRAYVSSKNKLPFEAERERAERAKAAALGRNNYQPDFSKAKLIPYKTFSLPSIIMQASTNVQQNAGSSLATGGYSVQTSGDFLNFGTRLVASGTLDQDNGHTLQAAQLTFNKQDPSKNLLGPLKAGSVSFGDVRFPDVPLAISSRRGRGLLVSSESTIANSSVFNPEVTLVDGDAPIGWDAELYRNGYFIAFTEVNNEGRYEFEDVELIKGFNLFEIVLYGPEGQKRTESQRIVRGTRMLQEGETNYEFALGQPEEDFIPLVENDSSNSAFGASGQVFHGIRKYLTLGASVFRGTDTASTLEDSQTAATASAITTFLGFRTQLQLMQATEGRSGFDVETTTRFKGVNFTLGHTNFKGFDNLDRRLSERTSANVNKNFGSFSASARVEQLKYLENDDETVIDTTLSTRLKGVELTNNLQRTISDNDGQDQFNGELAAAFNVRDWRVRSALDYNLASDANERLENFRLSGTKRFGQDHTLRLNATHIFANNFTRGDARYTKQIDNVSLDFNLAGDTENNYSAGVAVRTALQADDKGQYNFVNVRDGNLGSVGLRAYVDANGNEIYDDGETLLEDIKFRSNRGVIDDLTDKDGTVFVRGLSESVTRFSIEENSLPSIYLKPATDYVDAIPRSGTTATIDLAFSQLGEIDGFVYAHEKATDGKEKPVPGIQIMLIDLASGEEVQSTETEYDGYYIFSAIPLSNYRIQVVPLWGDEDSLVAQDVSLNADNHILLNVNHVLPPRSLVFETEAVTETDDLNALMPATDSPMVLEERYYVQMGSMGKLDNAVAERERIAGQHAEALQGVDIIIRDVSVKGRLYHRILGAVDSRKAGKALCKGLKADKINNGCYVIKM